MISGQALLNPYLTLVVSSGFEFPSIKLTLRYETVVSTLTRVSFVYDHMSNLVKVHRSFLPRQNTLIIRHY